MFNPRRMPIIAPGSYAGFPSEMFDYLNIPIATKTILPISRHEIPQEKLITSDFHHTFPEICEYNILSSFVLPPKSRGSIDFPVIIHAAEQCAYSCDHYDTQGYVGSKKFGLYMSTASRRNNGWPCCPESPYRSLAWDPFGQFVRSYFLFSCLKCQRKYYSAKGKKDHSIGNTILRITDMRRIVVAIEDTIISLFFFKKKSP